MSNDIRKGDVGYVRGRESEGTKMVIAGARLPDGIFPASPSARKAAEPSETLSLSDHTTCARADWWPYHEYWQAQRATG